MKKRLIYCVLIISSLMFSCSKENQNKAYQESPTNISVLKEGKAAPGISISCSFSAGHEKGALCLIPYNGDIFETSTMSWVHIPCIGKGKECGWNITISLSSGQTPTTYDSLYTAVAILEDSRNESEFMMPARSFLVIKSDSASAYDVSESDDGNWINMPEQLWKQIDSIHYLLSTGVEVSEHPDFID